MALNKISIKSIEELQEHINSHQPTFYYASQTSTVIPYDKLEDIFKVDDYYLADLSRLPSSMELNESNNLFHVHPSLSPGRVA